MDRKNFRILSPPPNVTGSLHIGHAFTFSVQDFIARLHKNFFNSDSFLLGGFDHGGLAAEKSAEKAEKLSNNYKERYNQIHKFAEKAKNNIDFQFKKLNLLMPDEFKKYTLDDDHLRFVRKTFTKLYRQGLITRKKGIANFDTKFKTTISDLEVKRIKKQGKLYEIPYKTTLGEDLIVSTTRPETIFADICICVNPSDDRYKNFIGQTAFIPILEKEIPILAHDYVEIDFGSGVLKVTPAHDVNDFRIFESLFKNKEEEIINIISKDHTLDIHQLKKHKNFTKIALLHGKSMEEARNMILDIIKPAFTFIDQQIPIGEKSEAVVETLLLDQWFFDVSNGAKMALDAPINIYPKLWHNNYTSWLKNINPMWCISRSTVWGHTIPAYFNKNGEILVDDEISEEEASQKGYHSNYEVFDTWFSSALWPLTYKNAFGFYPTDVLVTAYDILFFWVARMVMMSLVVDNSIPFHNVYLHRLVTDEEGKKMSKTVGNVIDPLEIIDSYGSDVLRLALLKVLSPCGKIRMSEKSLKEAQIILTKIKNFEQYLDMQIIEEKNTDSVQDLIEGIKFEIFEREQRIIEFAKVYDVHLIVDEIVDFLYETCSWLLEFTKTYKELLPFLKSTFIKIKMLFSCLCPGLGHMHDMYLMENHRNKNQSYIDLKLVIEKIRSFIKLGMSVGISGKHSDLIVRMTGCSLEKSGKILKIGGFICYLSDIKTEIIIKKIENNQKEIKNIQEFLSFVNHNTPKEVAKEKNQKLKSLIEETSQLENIKNVM